jgi:hypothetical protein
MPDMWFTADFHFGHNNIIRYCNRPPWLVEQKQRLQLERNGALFGVHGLCAPRVLDTAEIVRDAIFQQTRAALRCGF